MKQRQYTPTERTASGTKYGPLQSDGFDYLCPDCGGDGRIGYDPCDYCKSVGAIPLDDPRVFPQ